MQHSENDGDKKRRSRYAELDLSAVHTYSVTARPSKVKTSSEAVPPQAGMTVSTFLQHLPSVLKADDLKTVAGAVVAARQQGLPIIAMLGGHVIKCGCSPVLADLAENGFITHLASNGSAAIHDTELAKWGQTSEDVAEQLADGSFGMARETGEVVNGAAREAVDTQRGFGETLGCALADAPEAHRALLARAYSAGVPYTLHVAMGTDIVHQHPSANGGAIGEASMRDFRILAAAVAGLEGGGVVLNLGSAVIMPEVFLKTVAVARNLGHRVEGFTTANFDMLQHYRPRVNVVQRPVMGGGQGYSITGHHEIMLPLLAAAIKEQAEAQKED